MPALMKVQSLRAMAISEVENVFVQSALFMNPSLLNTFEYSEKELQFQEVFVSALPPCLREEILRNILSRESLDDCVRFHSLKMLISKSTHSLSVGSYSDSFYSNILKIISDKGVGLSSLDLRGVWLRHEESAKLRETLKTLPSLKILHIPHMATDEVIDTVSCYNQSMKILNISGESKISRIGIALLCRCRNTLEVVDIGRPGDGIILEPSAVSLLIKYLPNLLSLGTYSYVGRSLVCFDQDFGGGPLKLRYVHDTGTDKHTVCTIARMCPNLISIYLDRPSGEAIQALSKFENLTEIKLCRFESNDLHKLLMKCGERLTVLNLVIGRGVLDISVIAEHCVDIVSLTLYKMEHIVYLKKTHMMKLRKLDVLYATFSTSCLKYLVSASPILEHLSLYCNFMLMTDDVIISIFNDTPCKHLNTLWITNASLLTLASVSAIMAKCTGLKELGHVATWGLSVEDIESLRYEVRSQNLEMLISR